MFLEIISWNSFQSKMQIKIINILVFRSYIFYIVMKQWALHNCVTNLSVKVWQSYINFINNYWCNTSRENDNRYKSSIKGTAVRCTYRTGVTIFGNQSGRNRYRYHGNTPRSTVIYLLRCCFVFNTWFF